MTEVVNMVSKVVSVTVETIFEVTVACTVTEDVSTTNEVIDAGGVMLFSQLVTPSVATKEKAEGSGTL